MQIAGSGGEHQLVHAGTSHDGCGRTCRSREGGGRPATDAASPSG